MKRSSTVHKFTAIAVFLVWVAMIVAMVVNREFWADALPFVLLVSVATMVGTALLSRFWIRRKSVPSYGSIFVFPSVCVFLLFSADLLWNQGWHVFTLSFWEQPKVGFVNFIIEVAHFWFVCLFPAAAIVIYFQRPHDSEQTHAA